jgi:hypothetical protein
MDFLRYLYWVASPFVMLSEIELGLRALIRLAVAEADLMACIRNSLSQFYGENLPKTLEEMTFDNYKILLTNSNNWPHFQPVFGGTRRTSAKLKEVGEIRNDLFISDASWLQRSRDNCKPETGIIKARQADVGKGSGMTFRAGAQKLISRAGLLPFQVEFIKSYKMIRRAFTS